MKRGTRPQGKVLIKWSPKFAYAIGLLAADGCLYNDGRHISLTSKDWDQAEAFRKCLSLNNKIGIKNMKAKNEAYHVQFGDVNFYAFLNSIGLSKAKSKTMGELLIPDEYFADFLRGFFDGDGCSYSYYDPRWKSSFMFYISFAFGSFENLKWLQKKLESLVSISGHFVSSRKSSYFQLRYGKTEAVKLVDFMYAGKPKYFLSRKYLKIKKSMLIMNRPKK